MFWRFFAQNSVAYDRTLPRLTPLGSRLIRGWPAIVAAPDTWILISTHVFYDGSYTSMRLISTRNVGTVNDEKCKKMGVDHSQWEGNVIEPTIRGSWICNMSHQTWTIWWGHIRLVKGTMLIITDKNKNHRSIRLKSKKQGGAAANWGREMLAGQFSCDSCVWIWSDCILFPHAPENTLFLCCSHFCGPLDMFEVQWRRKKGNCLSRSLTSEQQPLR